jgi:hypothetical protein
MLLTVETACLKTISSPWWLSSRIVNLSNDLIRPVSFLPLPRNTVTGDRALRAALKKSF